MTNFIGNLFFHWRSVAVFPIALLLTQAKDINDTIAVQYLDEYGDPTSFFKKDGFLSIQCENYKFLRGLFSPWLKTKPKTFQIGARRLMEVTCSISGKSNPAIFALSYESDAAYQSWWDFPDYAMTNKQMIVRTPLLCPDFLRFIPNRCYYKYKNEWRNDEEIRSNVCKVGRSRLSHHGDYWSFPYHGVCGENNAVLARNDYDSTGSLCDYSYQPGRMPISLVGRNGCKTRIVLNVVPKKLIYVSQTFFYNKRRPLRIYVSSSESQVLNLTILDLANVITAEKMTVQTDRFSMDAVYTMDITKLEIRKTPYKVTILTNDGEAKVWFYLRLFDVTIVIVKQYNQGKIIVSCNPPMWKGIDNMIGVSNSELWNITLPLYPQMINDGSAFPTSVSRFECRCKVFTPDVSFPYNQPSHQVTTIGDTETITAEDLKITTVQSSTTSALKVKPEDSPSTTLPFASSPVTIRDSVVTILLALSEKVENDDLNNISKEAVGKRCQSLLAAAGCSDCLANVLPIKHGNVPIELLGIGGAQRKLQLTLAHVEAIMTSYFKTIPLDVTLNSGRRIQIIGSFPSNPKEVPKGDNSIIIAVCVLIGVLIIVLVIGFTVWIYRYNKSKKPVEKRDYTSASSKNVNMPGEGWDDTPSVTFSEEALSVRKSARCDLSTDDFPRTVLRLTNTSTKQSDGTISTTNVQVGVVS